MEGVKKNKEEVRFLHFILAHNMMIEVHCNKIWMCNVVILKETTSKTYARRLKTS